MAKCDFDKVNNASLKLQKTKVNFKMCSGIEVGSAML